MKAIVIALTIAALALAQLQITATTTYKIGNATCAPGQLLNVTLSGAPTIAACISYIDIARSIYATATWLNATAIRAEIYNFAGANRTATAISVKVYNAATSSLLASGSGTDYVILKLPAPQDVVVEISAGGSTYRIYKPAPPQPQISTPPTSLALPAAVVIAAIALAIVGSFVSEYQGGSSAVIGAFIVAAIAWIGLPLLGVPEAISTATAVLIGVIGIIAYARSRRE